MNTQERTLPNAVVILFAITIAIGAIVAAASLGAFSSTTQATDVTPVLLAGASNDGKTCADLQGSETWEELQLEGGDLTDGPHDDGTLEVTISNLGEFTFDWTSDIGVDGVVVKDGVDGANFYLYDPEATADTGLSTPGGQKAISHISFCYDEGEATPTPTPTTTPTPTPAAEASPTPTPTALAAVQEPEALAEVQEPEALPASGGTPADGSGLGILPLLLALSGLAFLGSAGTLVAAKVRRRR